MAAMTQSQAQALVDEDAALLRFVHNTLQRRAEAGDPWAAIMLPMVDKMHADAAALVDFAGLTVPGDGSGGVVIMSGGGGK